MRASRGVGFLGVYLSLKLHTDSMNQGSFQRTVLILGPALGFGSGWGRLGAVSQYGSLKYDNAHGPVHWMPSRTLNPKP